MAPASPVRQGGDRLDLPPADLSRQLAEWLAGPRGRILRRASIGLRRRVLEIGCGHCPVTPELTRRACGPIIALDRDIGPARNAAPAGAGIVCGDARALPFADAIFDLVFLQNVLLWVGALGLAVSEAARVLAPGGALVAVEPDYGAMICQPEMGLREVWTEALAAAGADPLVGRKLPAAFEGAGLEVWVELAHLPQQARPESLALLEGLPLSSQQREVVQCASELVSRASGRWGACVHTPYFLVIGHRPRHDP